MLLSASFTESDDEKGKPARGCANLDARRDVTTAVGGQTHDHISGLSWRPLLFRLWRQTAAKPIVSAGQHHDYPTFLAARAFDPDTIIQMAAALERACAAMGLRGTDDQVAQLVAQKIIQLVERGVAGADKLSSQAIRELTERE